MQTAIGFNCHIIFKLKLKLRIEREMKIKDYLNYASSENRLLLMAFEKLRVCVNQWWDSLDFRYFVETTG